MTEVSVNPELIRWACTRSGMDQRGLEDRFKALPQWLDDTKKPTLRQLEDFARATLTPLGALFLDTPPNETLPIDDFRTMGDQSPRRITAPLLETIYQMQRRQDWLREYLEDSGAEPLPFFGSATLDDDPDEVARNIREQLGMTRDWAAKHKTWEDALRALRNAAETLRIMVVINGCVGNNTRKVLDPHDFRGFVLADAMAPLIFINGADWKPAQMFTIAHELAHIWIGRGALFNLNDLNNSRYRIEQFCNRVAAEVLLPARELRDIWPQAIESKDPWRYVSSRFKVSMAVAARRAFDQGLITKSALSNLWKQWIAIDKDKEKKKKDTDTGGGMFYPAQGTRIGKLFGHMVIRAAREGRIPYHDAYRLTGLHGNTFERFSSEIGFNA